MSTVRSGNAQLSFYQDLVPAHEILVFIASASSEDSGEPEPMHLRTTHAQIMKVEEGSDQPLDL